MNFFSAVIQVFGTRCVVIGMSVLTSVISLRMLGPANAGIFALILLVRTCGFRFFNFGIPSAQAYYAARNFYSLRRMMVVGAVSGVVLSAVGGLVLYGLKDMSFSPWRSLTPSQFGVGAFFLLIYYFENIFFRILTSRMCITQVNIAEVARPILLLILLGGLCWIPTSPLIIVLLANGISDLVLVCYFVGLVFFERHSKQTQPFLHPSIDKRFFMKYCFWNYWICLLQYVNSDLGYFFFGNYRDVKLMGYYSSASTLIAKSESLSTPLSQMLFPFNAHSSEIDGAQRTTRLVRLLLPLLSLMVLVACLLINPLVLILYGRAFLPTISFFLALTPCIVSAPLAKILAIHFISTGEPKIPGIGNSIAIAITFGLCFMAFPSAFRSPWVALWLSVGSWIQWWILLGCFCWKTGTPMTNVLLMQKEDLFLVKNQGILMLTKILNWVRI